MCINVWYLVCRCNSINEKYAPQVYAPCEQTYDPTTKTRYAHFVLLNSLQC